ncbi:AraC family transcriptional regulator [Tenacibaculum sp. nBUS_03]|uniref:AraC family transcriptional regulator n=1 Tax=Tenacibaculum sp. nBUS_03 TaxID=3395320 RepID=UPI003EB748FE
MKKYDLHKNDYSKLHFELKAISPFFSRNKEKASKPHRHSFFQLLWFRESGRHYIDYKVFEHPRNSLFLINKNQVHYFCPDSSNKGYLFHFNDSFISKFNLDLLSRFSVSIFNEFLQPFINFTNDQSQKIEDTVKILLKELEQKNENYEDVVMHFFLGFLFQIERINKAQQNTSFSTNSDFKKIVEFKQLILDKIDQNLGIQSIADSLSISSKKLTSITKAHTSLTPANLIKELKILEAKRMLSNHNISIKEVAYSLGFDQPTYFTKFFKKEVQLTPKEFQKSIL